MNNTSASQMIEDYTQSTSKSRDYSVTAMNYIPGLTTRDLTFFEPYPPYLERGKGCKVFDVDGNEWIDFFNNATSLILGHAHPAVVEAVQERVAKGTAFHGPTPLEVEHAKGICERLESVERLRFTNSGTEAGMFAVRAARKYTGKNKVGKFEGGYHGTFDEALVSYHPDPAKAGPAEAPWSVTEPGVSKRAAEEVVVLPFNNSDAVEQIVKREKDDLACVIVEPMMGSAGIIPAKEGFLADLRKITLENDVLLIFDEVQTFRHSWGGAQEVYNIRPDLTTLAKIIGGGFPVGAFGGKKEIMGIFDNSSGKERISHGGTFNGNPITMTAGITTLAQLTREVYVRLNNLGEQLRTGLSDLFQRYEYQARITGEASFFKIHYTNMEIWDYRSAVMADDKEEKTRLFFHLLNNGIFISRDTRGNLSTATGEAEINNLMNVVEDYLKKRNNKSV
ncbi:aspartate aminotransferase family protein [Thermodesulfobacteriota bacterium]